MSYGNGRASVRDASLDITGGWAKALAGMNAGQVFAFRIAHYPDGQVVRAGSGSAGRFHGFTNMPMGMVQPRSTIPPNNLGGTAKSALQGTALAQALAAAQAAIYKRGSGL